MLQILAENMKRMLKAFRSKGPFKNNEKNKSNNNESQSEKENIDNRLPISISGPIVTISTREEPKLVTRSDNNFPLSTLRKNTLYEDSTDSSEGKSSENIYSDEEDVRRSESVRTSIQIFPENDEVDRSYNFQELIKAISNTNQKETEKLIIQISDQEPNNTSTSYDYTMLPDILNYLMHNGATELVKTILPKINSIPAICTVNNKGNTILHYAAAAHFTDIVKLLINIMDEEAINRVNNEGNTALHYATANGQDMPDGASSIINQ